MFESLGVTENASPEYGNPEMVNVGFRVLGFLEKMFNPKLGAMMC